MELGILKVLADSRDANHHYNQVVKADNKNPNFKVDNPNAKAGAGHAGAGKLGAYLDSKEVKEQMTRNYEALCARDEQFKTTVPLEEYVKFRGKQDIFKPPGRLDFPIADTYIEVSPFSM
jgi:hypothetical protein